MQPQYSGLQALPAEVSISTFVDWNLPDSLLWCAPAPLWNSALRSISFSSISFTFFLEYLQRDTHIVPCAISHRFMYQHFHAVTLCRNSFQSSPISPLHDHCFGPVLFSSWIVISVPLVFAYLARAGKSFTSSLVWTTAPSLPITRSQTRRTRVAYEWRAFTIPPTHTGQGDVFPASWPWFSSGLRPH